MSIINHIIAVSPTWVQYQFMGRVMQIVQESSQAGKVLQSKKKGGVRKGRRYRPSSAFRTIQLALLRLPRAHRQVRP